MDRTFDPADWLSRFSQVGGGYTLTDERLFLWVVLGDLTDQELSVARVLLAELTADQRAEIVGHLRTPVMVEG